MGASKKNIKEADASRKKILKSLDLLPDEISAKEVSELLEIDEKARGGVMSKCTKTLCKKFVAHMAIGRSSESAAILCKITPTIASIWKNPDHEYFQPEFFKAIKVGEALQKLWWDEIGRKNLHTKEFNNTLYMMIRQNMHGWTRRLDGKIEVKDIAFGLRGLNVTVSVPDTEGGLDPIVEILSKVEKVDSVEVMDVGRI